MRKHETKTTPVFLPADGEASWSPLPSLVSLLSGGTVQPENTYSSILKGTGHFHDEPRIQEKQQVKDQQSCIVFAACLIFPTNTRGTRPDMTTLFHTWAYGKYVEIQSNLRRKKRHRMN